jgi:hypothetical protein
VNTIISIAGSASEAIIISRVQPGERQQEAGAAEQRDDGDHVGGVAEHQPGGEGRHQRRRHPCGGEHQVRRDAEQPGRGMRQHHLLAQQAQQVPIGLHERRPLAAQHVRLQPAHEPREQRRECEHQRELDQLDDGVEGYCHAASTASSTTSAPNTRVR